MTEANSQTEGLLDPRLLQEVGDLGLSTNQNVGYEVLVVRVRRLDG
jgi:hypothetical protein